MAYHDKDKSQWKQRFQREWITKELDDDAIKFTDDFGKFLSRPLSTSQIRNIYGELKRIQMKGFAKEKTKFLLLKPKLAYATARSWSLEPLTDVLNAAFDSIDKKDMEKGEKQFANFMDFIEAILAYHKAYGGK
jgi:CRISPR-associated protein Csm2